MQLELEQKEEIKQLDLRQREKIKEIELHQREQIKKTNKKDKSKKAVKLGLSVLDILARSMPKRLPRLK